MDFQAHLDAARRPIDTYAMWGAACQIMDGLCSGDGFWYFQPWLIGQGRDWYEHAVRDPDKPVPSSRRLETRPAASHPAIPQGHNRSVTLSELNYVEPRFQYGFTSGFLGGVGRDARFVVDHLTHRAELASPSGANNRR